MLVSSATGGLLPDRSRSLTQTALMMGGGGCFRSGRRKTARLLVTAGILVIAALVRWPSIEGGGKAGVSDTKGSAFWRSIVAQAHELADSTSDEDSDRVELRKSDKESSRVTLSMDKAADSENAGKLDGGYDGDAANPLASVQAGSLGKEEAAASKKPPVHKPEGAQQYWVEALAAISAVIVGITAWTGRQQNFSVAERWLTTFKDFFEEQFHTVGFEDSYMRRKGWNFFEFFATGRRNIDFAFVAIHPKPRQCLWVNHVVGCLVEHHDVFRAELPLASADTMMIGIGQRKYLKHLKGHSLYLTEAAYLRPVPGLSEELFVVSDCGEAVERLMTPHFVNILNTAGSSIEVLIFGDKVLSSEKNTQELPAIFTSLYFPENDPEHLARTKRLFEFVIGELSDSIATLKLSDKAKAEAKKNRSNIDKMAQQELDATRQEALEKKRAAKKAEDDAKLERMTPAQQQKWDEKQYKKSLKKRGPKIKVQAA